MNNKVKYCKTEWVNILEANNVFIEIQIEGNSEGLNAFHENLS